MKKTSKKTATTGPKKPAKAPEVLLLFNFEITDDDDFNPYDFEITEEIATAVNTYLEMCQENPQKAVDKLPAVIARFPKVPLLHNHLFAALRKLGKHAEAFAANDQALQAHPDYVYARLNKAAQYFEKKELDEVERVLGGMPLTIAHTFPNRKIFHISEVFTYFGFLIRFWVEKDNQVAAEAHLHFLEDLEPDHPSLPGLRKLVQFASLKDAFGKLMGFVKKSQERRKNPKKPAASKTKKKGKPGQKDLFEQ